MTDKAETNEETLAQNEDESTPASSPTTLPSEETPESILPEEKRRERKDVIEALDRLVGPLDRILLLMEEHTVGQKHMRIGQERTHDAQKKMFLVTGIITLLLALAIGYQLQLTKKLGELEVQMGAVVKTGESTGGKLAETEKKVDDVKTRVAESDHRVEQTADIVLRRLVESNAAAATSQSAYASASSPPGRSPAPTSNAVAWAPRPRPYASISTAAPKAFVAPQATTYVPKIEEKTILVDEPK
jgi:hypothetical protein